LMRFTPVKSWSPSGMLFVEEHPERSIPIGRRYKRYIFFIVCYFFALSVFALIFSRRAAELFEPRRVLLSPQSLFELQRVLLRPRSLFEPQRVLLSPQSLFELQRVLLSPQSLLEPQSRGYLTSLKLSTMRWIPPFFSWSTLKLMR